MGRRLPRERIRQLKRLRQLLTMENSSFAMPGDHVIHHAWGPDAVPGGTRIETDDFIKDMTGHWREANFFPEIDDLIAWAEGKPGH